MFFLIVSNVFKKEFHFVAGRVGVTDVCIFIGFVDFPLGLRNI